MRIMKLAPCLPAMVMVMASSGCIKHHVKSDPIEIKPIHITVDVNVRVDKQLDDFFAFEKEQEETAR